MKKLMKNNKIKMLNNFKIKITYWKNSYVNNKLLEKLI